MSILKEQLGSFYQILMNLKDVVTYRKETILIMSEQGTGASTWGNYLSETQPVEKAKIAGAFRAVCKNSWTITNHSFKTETIYPVINKNIRGYVFCDSPSLHTEMLGGTQVKYAEIYNRLVAAFSEKIKIILVITINDLFTYAEPNFKYSEKFSNFFKEGLPFGSSDSEKNIFDSIVIVANKNHSDYTQDNIKKDFLDLLSSHFKNDLGKHLWTSLRDRNDFQLLLGNVFDNGESRELAFKALEQLIPLLPPRDLNINIQDELRSQFEAEFLYALSCANKWLEQTDKTEIKVSMELLTIMRQICNIFGVNCTMETKNDSLKTAIKQFKNNLNKDISLVKATSSQIAEQSQQSLSEATSSSSMQPLYRHCKAGHSRSIMFDTFKPAPYLNYPQTLKKADEDVKPDIKEDDTYCGFKKGFLKKRGKAGIF